MYSCDWRTYSVCIAVIDALLLYAWLWLTQLFCMYSCDWWLGHTIGRRFIWHIYTTVSVSPITSKRWMLDITLVKHNYNLKLTHSIELELNNKTHLQARWMTISFMLWYKLSDNADHLHHRWIAYLIQIELRVLHMVTLTYTYTYYVPWAVS